MSGVARLDALGLPAGRYTATIADVVLSPRLGSTGRRQWQLGISAVVERTGKRIVESRPMAIHPDDPYALTPDQRKGLQDLGGRLGVVDSGPAEMIVGEIRGLIGETVTAHVRDSRVGLLVTLTRDASAVQGEVLDALPKTEAELREVTELAQDAHEKLIMGRNHANRGCALMAESCWRLRQIEGWTALGYDSVGGYLADPDVSLKKTQFYALADIWEQYIERGGQQHSELVAPSKLEIPLPALKEGTVSVEEALADAQTLGLRDLRIKYRGEQDPTGEPKPERGPAFPFGCASCGTLIENEDGIVVAPKAEAA